MVGDDVPDDLYGLMDGWMVEWMGGRDIARGRSPM